MARNLSIFCETGLICQKNLGKNFLKVWWPYATLFVYFIFLLQYIHSYNHSLITFAEALLHIFVRKFVLSVMIIVSLLFNVLSVIITCFLSLYFLLLFYIIFPFCYSMQRSEWIAMYFFLMQGLCLSYIM
jgi:hypothetical protein